VAEDDAFRSRPLDQFARVHPEAIAFVLKQLWRDLLPIAPWNQRAVARVKATGRVIPTTPPVLPDPSELTKEVRARAAAIGLSAIGITKFDPRYTFASSSEEWFGQTVIVCVREQDYEATQTIPSHRAEVATHATYIELMEMTAKLCSFLHKKGFRARTTYTRGDGIAIHYAVEAGLGQLGINGQLLTPIAGSRCRLLPIYTDAPLVRDQPHDYGVTKLCDACKVCVRRCPSGAIPSQRKMHRGVEKSKIKPERCLPVVAQAHGCAICMKVCPVQRYGLTAVLEEFSRSGRVLGKNTDKLEGYDWLDGRHYGPGVRPKLDQSFLNPPGFYFDPNRNQAQAATPADPSADPV